ncbi:hypothetical protein ElyMa_006469400 [Elysia marginata]|uniref:Uncharacterized protein n=1 Tax=Elysia marginata TaxID=1093978 RepID=A0AAV4I0G5_9GAST|nr:hypothetical protein ElyMa_006469400 [Elysia marginata]
MPQHTSTFKATLNPCAGCCRRISQIQEWPVAGYPFYRLEGAFKYAAALLDELIDVSEAISRAKDLMSPLPRRARGNRRGRGNQILKRRKI